MHEDLVYAKTAKGVAEIATRSGVLTLAARRVLIMIDGVRPLSELVPLVRNGEFDGILATLKAHGMIELAGLSPEQVSEDEKRAKDDGAAAAQNAPAHVRAVDKAAVTTPPPPPPTINASSAAARPATLRGARPQAAPRPPTLNGARPAAADKSGAVTAAAAHRPQPAAPRSLQES